MIKNILIYGFSFGVVGILGYILLRYGPVRHSWMRISRQQQKKIEQAHEEYVKNYLATEKMKPAGKPLYKKALVSHNGLTIYSDGLYAKFCVGSKGRYKFKKFDKISDIFPVEVESPFVKTDSILLGLKSWKELQIETKDYETILINSRKHDFEVIIPILKDAMGTRWEGLYRESEVIRGKIIEGYVGWHTFIRGRTVTKEKIVEKKSEGAATLSKDRSKGDLLIQESPEVVKNRARALNKLGALLIILGVLFLIFMISYHWYFPASYICIFSMDILFGIFGILFIILAIVLFRLSRWRFPMQVYEHGIVEHMVGTGEEFFIPFGQFKNISEGSNIFEGGFYRLEAKNPRFNVNLSKKIPDLGRYLGFIKDQIGRLELDYPVETPGLKLLLKRFEYIMHTVIIILSLIFGYYLSNAAFEGSRGKYFLFGFAFFFSIICLIITFVAGLKFISIYRKNKIKSGINLNVIGVIFIIVLVVFFSNYYVAFFVWSEEVPIQIMQDAMPPSSVPLSSLTNNSQIVLNNNLVLQNNENLLLYNTTLIFNCSIENEHSIWIGENSIIELINCTVQSQDENLGFGFEIYGTAKIIDTTIMNVWGDEDNINWDGGIEIYSDSVSIINCTILNGKTNGILIFKCSPLIMGNTIKGCSDDGIEIHYSNAVITENIIAENGWGIVIWPETDVSINRNTVQDNMHGIAIESSSPVIENNTFLRNSEYAISYDSNSDPRFSNNYFEDNGEDIKEPETGGLIFFEVCGTIVFVMAIVFFVILWSQQKKYFSKTTL